MTSQRCVFCTWVLVQDVRFGRYKPTKKTKFWRLHYLSWPNRNSNRNRLPLGTVLYSYDRQQLITTMSTRERLQRDRATPEMNCWDDMRQFNDTRKGAARSLRAFEPILQCALKHTATRLVHSFIRSFIHSFIRREEKLGSNSRKPTSSTELGLWPALPGHADQHPCNLRLISSRRDVQISAQIEPTSSVLSLTPVSNVPWIITKGHVI